MTHRFPMSDSTQLAVQTFGEGEDVVLLVHGWMTSGLAMRETATKLAAAGFRVIVPDLRGAGASTTQHGDFSLERYVDDLLAVLDALQVTKCAVVGHSMGGQIASLLAITDPERVTKQVLVSPVPASGLPLPEDALGLFRSAPNNPEALGTILDLATINLPSEMKTALVAEATKISEACMQGSLTTWMNGGFEARLGETRAKTLVVASEDPFLPVPFLQQAVVDPIPEAELTVVSGAGHYIQLEQPTETLAALRNFLTA